MDHDLSDFLGEAPILARQSASEARIVRDLLVFEYGAERYALLAMQVDSVIAWQRPAPVPGTNARVHGVIQDRGRIVVVFAHPAGLNPAAKVSCKRVILCKTSCGLLGLPASVTNAVAALELRAEPTHASLHDGKPGAYTFIDPEYYTEGR